MSLEAEHQPVQRCRLDLERVVVGGHRVLKIVRNGAKHLQEERVPGTNKIVHVRKCSISKTSRLSMIELKPVENVELFDEALNAGGDQVVGEVVAVYLQDGGHDQQVAARVEDVLELVRGVDNRGQTVSGTGPLACRGRVSD